MMRPCCGDLIGVEADLQLRAVALHLVENPLPRGADAARRRTWSTTSVLRVSKLSSFFRMRAEALFGDVADELRDARIEVGLLRDRGPRLSAQ